jgi:hypothetical protein
MIWRLCGAVLVVVLVAGAWALAGSNGGGGSGSPSSSGSAPGTGGQRPYDGTPAASYPVGAAGITMPAPQAVAGWSATQVSSAQKMVKGALVAGHLDHRMVVERQTDVFVALFAVAAQSDVRQTFLSGPFSGAAVRVAPGATLAADQPRVRGTTTVATSVDDGGLAVLEIVTNYVWVYAFTGESKEPGDRLVIVHDELRWWVYHQSDVRPTSAGLWLNHSEGSATNVDCAITDKRLIGPAPLNQKRMPGSAKDTYDPSNPVKAVNTCR